MQENRRQGPIVEFDEGLMANRLTLMLHEEKEKEGKEHASALLHPGAYLFIEQKLKTKKYKPALASLHLKSKTLQVILLASPSRLELNYILFVFFK